MISTTEAEAEDWLTFLRWRLVSQLLRTSEKSGHLGDIALFSGHLDFL